MEGLEEVIAGSERRSEGATGGNSCNVSRLHKSRVSRLAEPNGRTGVADIQGGFGPRGNIRNLV